MTETEKLTCTKVVKVSDGKDMQGKPVWYHKKCGAPASEVEIGGLLTKAKAILCVTHARKADKDAFISENGYPFGKVKKKLKEEYYVQPRLRGTGLLKS
jgi:hypothetical protein